MRRGSYEHIHALAKAQALTQALRRSRSLDHQALSAVLGPETLRDFIARLDEGPRSVRGTTQISVADAAGNLASLTLSNGEGSGYVLPGTGIMLNNMLGEEDLMPRSGSVWPSNQRIGSMMAPTLLARSDGSWVVTGSSGSNRIRSAVLQVICNLVDFDLDLETAVSAPRLHFEGELLSLEPPVEDTVWEPLCAAWPEVRLWSRPSLFFGGAHSVVLFADGGGAAAGDPRRGGATAEV
jgi:gamma-glutamyltranspeptidase/glutathione hydrolase